MQNCGNCRFIRAPYIVSSPREGGEPVRAGYCHRTLPVMSMDLQTASHRPVKLAGWCGEWRFSVRAWWRSRRAHQA